MRDSEEKRSGPQPVAGAAEYEACTPGSLPTGQMALVHAIQEKFLEAFALALADRLEAPITAQLVAAEPVARSAFQESVEEGGHLLTLEAEPVRGQVLAGFSAGLVAYLLRSLLYAPPSSTDSPRAVTDIELHILHAIFESLAHELTAAWKATGIAFHARPSGARDDSAGQDTMLVFECRLAVEETQEIFRIAVPALLARIAAMQSASEVIVETPGPGRDLILNAMRRGNVTVEAVLSNTTLRMGDLLAMEPGHVLMLSQAAGSPVECRIGGKTKFCGDWIRLANRHALVLL